ncbi:MAG: minichromosome maintenance protein MCM, partial [Candidatus Bathyarchaeia archaeon]
MENRTHATVGGQHVTAKATLDPLSRFQEFFKSTKYRGLIRQMAVAEKRSLIVDYMDLSLRDADLAAEFRQKPDEYYEVASKALLERLKVEDADYYSTVKTSRLHVRVVNLPEKASLRNLGAQHIDKFVCFDGIVVRATPVKPMLMNAAFKCKCGQTNWVKQDRFFIRIPGVCENPSCRRESGFDLWAEKSEFIDSQELRLQERPEDLPPGQLPRAVEVSLQDDVVDVARPGDRVTVSGVVRARPEVIPGKGRLRVFNIQVDANHVETVGKEVGAVELSKEDELKIKEIAKREFIYQDLLKSIAPSIYGNEDLKEAILYLLFGGVPKLTPEGVPIRGDVHVLVVGDPGTAKSQLLRYVSRVSPRGLFTSGRGTTAAGLTAAVIRDRTGGMVLEAGALVLADKGVAAVDEIDKMRDEDRIAMHEMMEQQTVSVAKGGIVATLNARASILAAANPKFGRYEDRLPVTDNINIPVVILSRFDLIFIQKDRPQKELDEQLSEHIMNVHKAATSTMTPPIVPELLRKYAAYARTKIHPRFTEEASDRLRNFYLKMRSITASTGESPVAITPRQLEALIRLSEARARVALRETITAMDAEAAIKIMEKSLRDVGVVREEEVVDIDVIMTGKSLSVREGLATIVKLVGEM